ncbi:hypothetical protein GWK47_035820 [Chionoecetes opilio]|uniref:Uncharacterized protein n=1 Tax=Chionoecetes opilio TaxID=41210 RepID=A0A8J4YGE7_CHIOP|nr:hypothetical protein GWK47_035820 [Chionoecetes opilio]
MPLQEDYVIYQHTCNSEECGAPPILENSDWGANQGSGPSPRGLQGTGIGEVVNIPTTSWQTITLPEAEAARATSQPAGEVTARCPLPSPPATTQPAAEEASLLASLPASSPQTSRPPTSTSSRPGTPAGPGEHSRLVSQVLQSHQDTQDLLQELIATQREAVATQREAIEVQRSSAEIFRGGVDALSEIAALALHRLTRTEYVCGRTPAESFYERCHSGDLTWRAILNSWTAAILAAEGASDSRSCRKRGNLISFW